MLHSNDVDIFYNIVTDIYCSSFMQTLAKDLVFNSMRKNVKGVFLEKLELEFLSNMYNFELSSDTFNPRNCYRYEGAK